MWPDLQTTHTHVVSNCAALTANVASQGQQQTVMFCGDGLNDLAALGTAEVGMAIGPIDAMAAAPVSRCVNHQTITCSCALWPS